MTGLLVMAYGSPQSLDEVEAYYTHIRRGRPPSPELLEELLERYRAIGGRSPLVAITRRQARALEERLAGRFHEGLIVDVGMKHSPPFIAEGVRRLVEGGATRLITLTMAPQYSAMSVGEYQHAVMDALRQLGAALPVIQVPSWHRHEGFVNAVARRLHEALHQIPEALRDGAVTLFTAHSLPERVLAAGDPYPRQFEETAAAVARAARVERWHTAYQSAGRTADPWLGPDVNDVLRELAAQGTRAVVICPVGFVADHLEILYDVDIEARRTAAELGLAFARTESLNDGSDFMDALAAVVTEHAARAGWL